LLEAEDHETGRPEIEDQEKHETMIQGTAIQQAYPNTSSPDISEEDVDSGERVGRGF
jgi:hypothetical protein